MSFFAVVGGLLLWAALPGLAPAGDLLSFCGAKKKVGKEKGPSSFGHAASTRALHQTNGKTYWYPRFIAATEAPRPNELAPLFLLTFFLARQKKSESPAGARPGNATSKKNSGAPWPS